MLGCIEILHPFLDRFWDFVSSMDQTKIPNHCFLNRFVDAGFGCHRKHFSCCVSMSVLRTLSYNHFGSSIHMQLQALLSSSCAATECKLLQSTCCRARCCRALIVNGLSDLPTMAPKEGMAAITIRTSRSWLEWPRQMQRMLGQGAWWRGHAIHAPRRVA